MNINFRLFALLNWVGITYLNNYIFEKKKKPPDPYPITGLKITDT